MNREQRIAELENKTTAELQRILQDGIDWLAHYDGGNLDATQQTYWNISCITEILAGRDNI